nr:TOBE-like domain-containing protein [Patulibacter sp. SYSU D01012]
MSFLGPVATLHGDLVRPHDLRLAREAHDGAVAARVRRVAHLGFEVRVELTTDDAQPLSVQTTRDEAARLGLREGDTVHVRREASVATLAA